MRAGTGPSFSGFSITVGGTAGALVVNPLIYR
jgi:hypothetical protein